MKGGKVLGSGTYGCILKPPLPCRGSTIRPPDTVSKLMLEHAAIEEMDEITKISGLTKKIPNHNDYYILNQIRICPPANLTSDDLIDFNKKCTAMLRKGIKEKDINQKIDQRRIAILQLPDGGFDLSHFLGKGNLSERKFTVLMDALLKLLIGGVAPLNKAGVLHQDLKAPNMVYSEKNNLARIIDWGLSTTIRGKSVPGNVRGWPIMFNAPFSILVFHKSIQRTYNYLMKSQKMQSEISKYQGQDLITGLHDIVHTNLKKLLFENDKSIIRHVGSLGHLHYLESVLKKIVQLSPPSLNQDFVNSINSSPFKTLTSIISSHMAKVFLTFSVNSDNTIGDFRDDEYFNKVYRINCDIVGFISLFYDLMNNTQEEPSRRFASYKIIKKYQFSTQFATEAINLQELVKDISDNFLPSSQLPVVTLPTAPKLKKTVKRPIIDQLKKDNFTWSLTRRCPKGYRRNKKTQKCSRIQKDVLTFSLSKKCPKGYRRDKKTKKCNIKTTKRHRCPNGTRMNKKTGKCEPK